MRSTARSMDTSRSMDPARDAAAYQGWKTRTPAVRTCLQCREVEIAKNQRYCSRCMSEHTIDDIAARLATSRKILQRTQRALARREQMIEDRDSLIRTLQRDVAGLQRRLRRIAREVA